MEPGRLYCCVKSRIIGYVSFAVWLTPIVINTILILLTCAKYDSVVVESPKNRTNDGFLKTHHSI